MGFLGKAIDNIGKKPTYLIAYIFVLAVIVAIVWFGWSKIKNIATDLKDSADQQKLLDEVEQETGKRRKLTHTEAQQLCAKIESTMGIFDEDKDCYNAIRNSRIESDVDCVYLNQVWRERNPDGFDPNGFGDNLETWQQAIRNQMSSSTCTKINTYLKSIGISNPYLV